MANSKPGTPQDWDRVFANYTATVDNPGCCVWRELLAIGLSFAGVVAVLGGLWWWLG